MRIFNLLLSYPIFMSLYWIVGTILYAFLYEIKLKKHPSKDIGTKGISFLVPCFNESKTIVDTISNLYDLEFPNKQIIIINDGSTDDTATVIENLNKDLDFEFVNLTENQGKANALNQGLEFATYDFVMVIDADTIIDDKAPFFMLEAFDNNPKLAAVTGNPRIRNKKSLLGKIQTVEYASIIGCIKRSQSIAGKINTISGVFTLFRKSAVEQVGKWDTDMITEDIAVSWKFHIHNLTIKYEPRALCWMLVPETIGGLWKQRIRWAQGGQEVLIRDFKPALKSRSSAFYMLLFEQVFSLLWVFTVICLLIISLIQSNFLDVNYLQYQFTFIIISAFVLTFINIIQFTIALIIDSKYEKINIFILIFLSWYPTVYWFINALVAIFAFPKALKRKKGAFATWTSPDRGNIQQ